jgi:hypothetical protein
LRHRAHSRALTEPSRAITTTSKPPRFDLVNVMALQCA